MRNFKFWKKFANIFKIEKMKWLLLLSFVSAEVPIYSPKELEMFNFAQYVVDGVIARHPELEGYDQILNMGNMRLLSHGDELGQLGKPLFVLFRTNQGNLCRTAAFMRFDRHDEDSVLGFRHSKLIPIDPSRDPQPVRRYPV